MHNDESPSESEIDEGNIKVETAESESSTSQDTNKLDSNTLFDKIGELFDMKTKFMASDIKLNIATNAETLKSDITTLKSELKSDMTTLKSEHKSDIVTNTEKLKLDMTTLKSDMTEIKTSHNDLMSCIGAIDVRMNKVEKLTSSVSLLVQTTNAKISENSTELEKIGDKVDHNKETIYELEKSVKRINEKAEPAVHTSPKIQTKGEGL